MSRSPSVRAAVLGAVLLLVTPAVAAAHAIGGTFQLPVPLWLYLAGAGTAVAASFVVTAVARRQPVEAPRDRGQPVPTGVASAARWVLRAIGLVWWYGAIAVGLLVGDISPLPSVLLWVGIWVGLPIVAVVIGNPWPSLSPFRTSFAILEWLARRVSARRLDAALPYPAWLARWPAVILLAAAVWTELVMPGAEVAATVAGTMLDYTLLTLAGMVLVGQVAWLRNAELFEVLLGWFGRLGPIGRRSVSQTLCRDCSEACDPKDCVDCPECAVAADDVERAPEVRPWATAVTESPARPGWSDAVFIVLALAGVTYDGMASTAFGATLVGWLLPPMEATFGITGTTFLLVDTLGLAAVVATFLAAFAVIVAATRSLRDRDARHGADTTFGSTAGRYAATLLPIAAGYLIAHYLTLLIQAVVWLPALMVDPLLSLQPELDWIPVSFVWYLSVASIVGGHVVAIVLAHRLALRDSPSRPVVAGVPMVALMVGYTILSLWIIAQPIVIEPGADLSARVP